MPRLTELGTIRSRLDRDRDWAAYAIGDLAPGFVGHSEWHASDAAGALVMIYRGFHPPILFAMGDADDLRPLFAEVTAPEVSLHVRPAAIAAMRDVYCPVRTRPMVRMRLRAGAFNPVPDGDVRVITECDVRAVEALYEAGRQRGDGPTFFSPAMLQQQTFRGIWEDGALVSVAGTHLYSAELGICTVGNVYTRADRRGRGMGARVTSAVVAHALAQSVATVVLNVGEDNHPARRVYQRLGFERYCDFVEGEARRI
jgi:GNAT superfamily N-acetyltransferase